MKRSTIATLATIAGVALLGGGAYAVTQIPSSEPATSATTEPGVIETSAASASPDTVESPAPSESPETEPAVEYTDAENEFLYGARQIVTAEGLAFADAELLAYGYEICAEMATFESETDAMLTVEVVPGLGRISQNDLNLTANMYLC